MSPALLAVGALLLLVSGVSHLRAPRTITAAVRRHGVLPHRLVGPVSASLVVVELTLGAGLLLAVVTGGPGAQRALGSLTVVIYLSLAVYAHRAWLKRPDARVPCACGVGEAPLGPWVTARAGLLALGTGVGAATVTDPVPAERAAVELAVLVCATLTLAVVVSLLPAARDLPRTVALGSPTR